MWRRRWWGRRPAWRRARQSVWVVHSVWTTSAGKRARLASVGFRAGHHNVLLSQRGGDGIAGLVTEKCRSRLQLHFFLDQIEKAGFSPEAIHYAHGCASFKKWQRLAANGAEVGMPIGVLLQVAGVSTLPRYAD